MKITGTFLDEITHDIPSNNWGPAQWDEDFAAMRAIGIDTAIVIRSGYADKCCFDSRVLQKQTTMLPAYGDLLECFLDCGERHGIDIFLGLYDSGVYWHRGDIQQELEINRRFCEELTDRYGKRAAFSGWYLSHEINGHDENMMNLYVELVNHLRSLHEGTVLISPYVRGRMLSGEAVTPEEHERQWDMIFSKLAGAVDVVAFQDGQVMLGELPTFMEINTRLARQYGITPWSNVESFARDMPYNFPVIDFRKLRYKMECAEKTGVEKLITFEFSHFMSPHSCYPSARQLYNRYKEWLNESSGIR